MSFDRFRKAKLILINGDYYLKERSEEKLCFIVKGKKEDYSVIISEDYISCTCEFSSFWNIKKSLYCYHVLACLGAMMKLHGPIILKDWKGEKDGR